MRKKQVGIITIVDLTNYGNRLQNYAVAEVMKKLGFVPKTLFIKEERTTERIKNKIKNAILKIPYMHEIKIMLCNEKDLKHLRYLYFDKFSRRNIDIQTVETSSMKEIAEECNTMDFFIIGSDQIWNPDYGYADDFSFAMFAKPEQKICCAPSFGVSEISEKYRAEISERLKSIPNIAVREKSGVDIVRELTGKEAMVLIDPTMLLTASEWDKVLEVPKKVDLGKKYILSYFLGKQTDEQRRKIESIKTDYNLVEYSLLNTKQPEIYVLGPSEFIAMIKNAELICTDSFHACVFSILYRKPFVAFKRDGNGAGIASRLDTLLETFKLTHRREENIDESSVLSCDFSDCYSILDNEREKVYCYLKENMKIQK